MTATKGCFSSSVGFVKKMSLSDNSCKHFDFFFVFSFAFDKTNQNHYVVSRKQVYTQLHQVRYFISTKSLFRNFVEKTNVWQNIIYHNYVNNIIKKKLEDTVDKQNFSLHCTACISIIYCKQQRSLLLSSTKSHSYITCSSSSVRKQAQE